VRFALVAAVLMFPWPGLKEAYGHFLRYTAQTVFQRENSKWFVLFKHDPNPHLDTTIYIGNRKQVTRSHQLSAARVSFTTRYVAYVPVALFAALVIATPLPLKRRLWALGCGLLLMHLFLGVLLLIMIIDQCSRFPVLDLITLSPFSKQTVHSLYDIFVTNLGARLALPVLLWIVVCFRRHDLQTILGIVPPQGRLQCGIRA